jgi:ABC-type sugar transport system substrate-binding protein
MRMLIRSLTLATLLAIAGPLFAADGDSPLDIDKGRARPLIVITSSTVDPVWVNLKKSLEDPANKQGVADRNIRVYSVLNMSGQLDGKDLGQQDTMALIRALKLGAGALPKVILVGKDGEKKLESSGEESKSVDLNKIFATVDALPATEKEASAPTPPPVAETPPPKGTAKAAKNGKPAKPAKPPEMPDD